MTSVAAVRARSVSAHRGEYLYLDIPRPSVLVPAVRTFLSRHAAPGAASGGQGRRRLTDVVPAVRRHTRHSVPTDAALGQMRTFPEQRPIGAVTFRTRQGWASPRCIELVDAASGRVLGEVAMGHLFLEDERDRSAALDILEAARIPVARPLDEPFVQGDEAWPESRIPNTWTCWFVQGSRTAAAWYRPVSTLPDSASRSRTSGSHAGRGRSRRRSGSRPRTSPGTPRPSRCLITLNPTSGSCSTNVTWQSGACCSELTS